PARREQGNVGRLLTAIRSLKREGRIAHVAWQEVDDAAERVRAIEARRAALHDFDARHGLTRHAAPVNPAAERVINRNAIAQDHGAARARRADAAQADALRRRVRRAAARTAEEREARHLSEYVIERQRRRRLNVFG